MLQTIAKKDFNITVLKFKNKQLNDLFSDIKKMVKLTLVECSGSVANFLNR